MVDRFEIIVTRVGQGDEPDDELLFIRGGRESVIAAIPTIGNVLGTPLAAASASVTPEAPEAPPAARRPGRPRKATPAAAEPTPGVISEPIDTTPSAQPVAPDDPSAQPVAPDDPSAQPVATWDPFTR